MDITKNKKQVNEQSVYENKLRASRNGKQSNSYNYDLPSNARPINFGVPNHYQSTSI